jgi:tricarballylate dehydrogenase
VLEHGRMDDAIPTICVVGSGAAGLAAALAAAESTRAQSRACRVMLIERARHGEHGGNTRFSPSYMRLAAPDQVAPGFEDDLNEVSGGRMDAEYIQRLAADAPATIAWLMGCGIAFDKPVYYLSAGPPRIQPVGGGAMVVRELERAAREADVVMHYERRAERLLVGRSGAVQGVEVRSESGALETIAASAVVLASGGFAGNGEMLAQHLGRGAESLLPISPGTRFNTGDGIRMALEAGARAAGDWCGMHVEPIDPRSSKPAPVVLVYPYGIVVDGRASDSSTRAAASCTRPGRVSRAPSTSPRPGASRMRSSTRSSTTSPAMSAQSARTCRPTGRPRTDCLAAAASLSPPKSNWCRPLDRPPYLAYPLIGAIAYTFGGIATNVHAQVLGASGPIPGLFAAGEITGHFHGTAPNAVAMLRALVYGRIAGAGAVAFCVRTRERP